MIDESIAKSKEGKTRVHEVAHAIRAVTEDVAKVKTLVDEVNLGSQEQPRGIDQISKSIIEMEQVAQSVAANAEKSAASAAEVNAQTHSMQQAVAELSELVG